MESINMKKIFDELEKEGFKATREFKCDNLDGIFSKDNFIFVIHEFSDRTDLQQWDTYQDEICRKIYFYDDKSESLDIYFILFLSFESNLQDISIIHKIEKDPYYCRKIIIRKNYYESDKLKLPFITFDLHETPGESRAKTIKEFLDSITKDEKERNIAEKIFDTIEEKKIADLLIDFFRKGG